MTNQITAKLRYLRMSPRKIRLVADLVRGKRVEEALTQLQFSPKQAALPLAKLLKSAVANAAHNHNIKDEPLVVQTITVNGGPVLDRWMPRAFGRASSIRKRTSHITVVLAAPKGNALKEEENKKVVKHKKINEVSKRSKQ